MTLTLRVVVLVTTLACVPAVAAGESLLRARSPHAEVLTNGSEAQARGAAEHIEVFHRVLLSALAPGAETHRLLSLSFDGTR